MKKCTHNRRESVHHIFFNIRCIGVSFFIISITFFRNNCTFIKFLTKFLALFSNKTFRNEIYPFSSFILNPERMSMQKRNCSSVCPPSDWLKNWTNQIPARVFSTIYSEDKTYCCFGQLGFSRDPLPYGPSSILSCL